MKQLVLYFLQIIFDKKIILDEKRPKDNYRQIKFCNLVQTRTLEFTGISIKNANRPFLIYLKYLYFLLNFVRFVSGIFTPNYFWKIILFYTEKVINLRKVK